MRRACVRSRRSVAFLDQSLNLLSGAGRDAHWSGSTYIRPEDTVVHGDDGALANIWKRGEWRYATSDKIADNFRPPTPPGVTALLTYDSDEVMRDRSQRGTMDREQVRGHIIGHARNNM